MYRSSGNIRNLNFRVGKFVKFFYNKISFMTIFWVCLCLYVARANIRNITNFVIFIFVIVVEYEINFTLKISRTTVFGPNSFNVHVLTWYASN